MKSFINMYWQFIKEKKQKKNLQKKKTFFFYKNFYRHLFFFLQINLPLVLFVKLKIVHVPVRLRKDVVNSMAYPMIVYLQVPESVIRVNVNRYVHVIPIVHYRHAQIPKIVPNAYVIYHHVYTNWHRRYAIQLCKSFKYPPKPHAVVRLV